jgi:hypothetical protein
MHDDSMDFKELGTANIKKTLKNMHNRNSSNRNKQPDVSSPGRKIIYAVNKPDSNISSSSSHLLKRNNNNNNINILKNSIDINNNKFTSKLKSDKK